MPIIITRVTALADTPNFITAFDQELSTGRHQTKAAAYEALELKRIKHFGARKFASYDSFRVVRRVYLSKHVQ